MKKKTEKLHRLVQKLSCKYGKEDKDVLRLQAELDSLVKMEQSGSSSESAPTAFFTGPSPAKVLYLKELRASRQ